MSIIITNISVLDKSPEKPDRYSLRINNMEICQFDHKQDDGIVKCLRNAADVFESLEKERRITKEKEKEKEARKRSIERLIKYAESLDRLVRRNK